MLSSEHYSSACLLDAEQRGFASRSLLKSEFKAFVNDVEKDPTQHEKRWLEGRKVHAYQILPGNVLCPQIWVGRTPVGLVMSRKFWQVIAVQHGVWEVCKLQEGLWFLDSYSTNRQTNRCLFFNAHLQKERKVQIQ